MVRKYSDFKDNKTFFINCINKRGFNDLFEGLYEIYKKNIISENNLESLKNCSMENEDFNQLFKNSFFFGNIKPENVFLNKSVTDSAKDIKSLLFHETIQLF